MRRSTDRATRTRRPCIGRSLLAVSLLLLFALCSIPDAHAIAIGVNRASIAFTDVLRNGFARETVVVTTDSLDPISAEVLLQGTEQAWLNFSARNFSFSRDRPYTLVVEVRPPSDAQLNTYRVNMSIITGQLSRTSGGQIGTTTRASLGVPISVALTGTQRLACRASGVQILDTERGQPAELRVSIQNTGNVRINPMIDVEVFDKLRTGSVAKRSVQFGSEILPTVTDSSTLFLPLDLPSDQYWATIKVPQCEGSELLTFDVLEPGGVKDDGELLEIRAEPWAEVGDIIAAAAIFRNNGVRALRASFHGTVSRVDDETIVKVIQTDEVIVDPGVTTDLETFFNPTEPGQYRVAGKVFYNQKLTIERDAIINVNGAPMGLGTLHTSTIVIFVMMLVVIILLILIIRRRRRRQGFYVR